jgi:hypothetical protein
MSFALTEEDDVPQTYADPLRLEFGWREVSSGLGRILLGHFVLIIGTLLCVGLVVYALFNLKPMPDGLVGKDQIPHLGYVWAFYIGFGVLSLIWLFGYGMIVAGEWRCLMSAPERHGCKWLMFACMTGLLMGPALNVAAGVTGMEKAPNYRNGPAGFAQVKFTKLGSQMQMASGVLGFSSFLFFMLFLRSVARCFQDTARLAHITAYLLLTGLLTSGTSYLAFANPQLLLQRRVLFGVGIGWLIAFVWYLGLVGSMRTCIDQGLAMVRSPLDPAECGDRPL